MAAYGVQFFKDDGVTVSWDSRTALGGVAVDTIRLAPNGTLTKTYPAFPGRNVRIIHLFGYSGFDTLDISTDTTLGYPRVQVGANPYVKCFLVVVY